MPWPATGERDYAGVLARAVVVATGAYDLQLPVPGWTLPGVMAAGAAQSLLKSSGVTAGRRVVVAGTGPFLLPVAAGLAEAGAQVVAVAEAGQPLDYLRHPAGLAASWRKLPEAGGYLARLARHRVPVLRRHAVIAAHGDGRLESVTLARLDQAWRPVPGTERTLAADVLAAGYGFVPQVELLGEAGAQLADGAPLAPGAPAAVAVAGPDQQTTVPGLFAAGETTGVGGSDLARLEGEIAGRAAARYVGRKPSRHRRAAAPRPGARQRCAGSPPSCRPCTPCSPAGPSGRATTPSCAVARRSRWAGCAPPLGWAPTTRAASSCWPAPAWAGARAASAARPCPRCSPRA